MDMTDLVYRGVEVAWKELERQSQTGTHPHVNIKDGIVDGFVDMPELVTAIINALRGVSDENRS